MANKAPKKIAPKKANKKPETEKENVSTSSLGKSPETFSSKKKSFLTKKRYIAIIIAIAVIFIALYFLRSYIVVATVNGQPISRSTFNAQLEKQGGKQVMNSLVQKMLIQQEADRKHITISQKEIDDQIKTIENNLAKKGQKLDQALMLSGLTRSDLEDQIRIQLTLEKLFAKDITVSDKEIDDYIAKYNSQNQTPDATGNTQQPQISRDDARQAIKQNKLSAKFKPWLDQLQSKAKIVYFVNLSQ